MPHCRECDEKPWVKLAIASDCRSPPAPCVKTRAASMRARSPAAFVVYTHSIGDLGGKGTCKVRCAGVFASLSSDILGGVYCDLWILKTTVNTNLSIRGFEEIDWRSSTCSRLNSGNFLILRDVLYLGTGQYLPTEQAMTNQHGRARTQGASHFEPDALFEAWGKDKKCMPQDDDLRSSIISVFNLPHNDSHVYHAVASVTLSQVQEAIKHGGQAGLHTWYLDDEGKAVRRSHWYY